MSIPFQHVKGTDWRKLTENSKKSPTFPNCVCGILIWARGFWMEGIKCICPIKLLIIFIFDFCTLLKYWTLMFWGVVVPALQSKDSWVVGFTFNAMNNMICWAVSWTCFLEQYFQGLLPKPNDNAIWILEGRFPIENCVPADARRILVNIG